MLSVFAYVRKKIQNIPRFSVISVSLILVLLIIVIILIIVSPKSPESLNKPGPKDGKDNRNPTQNVLTPEDKILNRNCEEDQITFTHHFTDPENISGISPLGGFRGGSPGRSYVALKDNVKAEVYNPTDAILETIIYAPRGPGVAPEYGLYFNVGCNIIYLLDHLDDVPPSIKSLAPAEPAESTATQYGSNPRKVIKAGELVGYTDGTNMAHTFDFLVINKNQPNEFISPEKWKWDQFLYAKCPYDFYTQSIKKTYYNLIGESSNMGFMAAESCGNPSSDIPGTASGGWFKPNGNTEDRWLGITKGVYWTEVVIREEMNPQFTMVEYESSVYPSAISPGDKICYRGHQNNWIYLYLASDKELKTVTGHGECPSYFPVENAESWVR